jgi:hypothetical protein
MVERQGVIKYFLLVISILGYGFYSAPYFIPLLLLIFYFSYFGFLGEDLSIKRSWTPIFIALIVLGLFSMFYLWANNDYMRALKSISKTALMLAWLLIIFKASTINSIELILRSWMPILLILVLVIFLLSTESQDGLVMKRLNYVALLLSIVYLSFLIRGREGVLLLFLFLFLLVYVFEANAEALSIMLAYLVFRLPFMHYRSIMFLYAVSLFAMTILIALTYGSEYSEFVALISSNRNLLWGEWLFQLLESSSIIWGYGDRSGLEFFQTKAAVVEALPHINNAATFHSFFFSTLATYGLFGIVIIFTIIAKLLFHFTTVRKQNSAVFYFSITYLFFWGQGNFASPEIVMTLFILSMIDCRNFRNSTLFTRQSKIKGNR